ncbi:DUF5316 family protein [Paenibacillus alba]|uniref:DUF5316 family protein n=1 Tax=Paenibacillus alba TaxID=1197127 RepID=A0ABU6GDL7_9BACL|nr:DUF5316 family protein [Paenibacillus alba]MEC0232297.1 DUF5316 family protein [Paenibacillus alba]
MKLLKSYLFIGFVTGLIVVLISLIMNHLPLAKTILGYFGGGLLLMGAVYSGSMVGGDRMRANTYSEDRVDRISRINVSGIFLKLGAPNLILCFVLFYLKV